MQFDSIYMKFKHRQNQIIRVKVRLVVTYGEKVMLSGRIKRLWRVDNIPFPYLVVSFCACHHARCL